MGEWRAHVRLRSGDLQVARGRGAGTSRNNSRHYGNTEKGVTSGPPCLFYAETILQKIITNCSNTVDIGIPF